MAFWFVPLDVFWMVGRQDIPPTFPYTACSAPLHRHTAPGTDNRSGMLAILRAAHSASAYPFSVWTRLPFTHFRLLRRTNCTRTCRSSADWLPRWFVRSLHDDSSGYRSGTLRLVLCGTLLRVPHHIGRRSLLNMFQEKVYYLPLPAFCGYLLPFWDPDPPTSARILHHWTH